MKNIIILLVLVVVFSLGSVFLFASRGSVDKTAPALPGTSLSGGSDTSSVNEGGRYVTYSENQFNSMSDKRRVYFFHASWCPTCKVANSDFEQNGARIPQDVILFKTDYDSYAELKRRYGITYQHTFVQVDRDGNEISKWNGGGVNELIANLK